MSDSKHQTQGVDFDLGTSPHGLSAESSQAAPEASRKDAPQSLADGFDLAVQGQPKPQALSVMDAERKTAAGNMQAEALPTRDTPASGASVAALAATESALGCASPAQQVEGHSNAVGIACEASIQRENLVECFMLTEEQRCHLAYAAFCQIEALRESDEAEEPEVLEGIRLLTESHRLLNEGRPV